MDVFSVKILSLPLLPVWVSDVLYSAEKPHCSFIYKVSIESNGPADLLRPLVAHFLS